MFKYFTQPEKFEDMLSSHIDFTFDLFPRKNGFSSFKTGLNMSNTKECKKKRQKSQPTAALFRLYK